MSAITEQNSPMCIYCMRRIDVCGCGLVGMPAMLRKEVQSAVTEIDPVDRMDVLGLSRDELHTVREWLEIMANNRKPFILQSDVALAQKIYTTLGMKPPSKYL